MQLTENFSLAEMTISRFAALHGFKNDPDMRQAISLCRLCRNVLQPLRDAIKQPITVTSGFRSSQLNNAIEGAPQSQHMRGEAADIIIPGYSFTQIMLLIRRLRLPVDQLIDEHGQWVHLSHTLPENTRGEVLVVRYINHKLSTTHATNLFNGKRA